MRRLLAALDHPELRLPPVFHIAGTNGKGSTASFLSAIGEAMGLRVHLYTSPHLHRFHERIQFGHTKTRTPIAEAELEQLLTRVRDANGSEPITYFEITTAAALLGFAEHPADMLVLETGLGGRLDATNVVKHPQASLLTPIDMDHQDYLGSTLAAIAREKGGIIKPGRLLVSVRQRPAAAKEIINLAKKRGAPLLLEGRDWHIHATKTGLSFEDRQGKLDLPRPSLPGLFQQQNAGLALAAFRAAPPPSLAQTAPPQSRFALALRRAHWPGRMERLNSGAWVRAAQPHEVWLDGGHNPHAGKALAASFAALPNKKALFILCAMRQGKNIAGFLRPFVGVADAVFSMPLEADATLHPPERITAISLKLGLKAQSAASLEEAVELVRAQAKRPSRILLCGTLSMAAGIKE